MKTIKVRSGDEIQRAHDRLEAIVKNEVPYPFTPGKDEAAVRLALEAARDVLCWVLHHDANPIFAENIEAIDEFLRDRGLVLAKPH